MFNKQTKLINSKYKKGNPYLCITQKIKLNPTTTVVKIIKHKNSNSYSSLNNLIKQDSKISYDKKIRSISPKMSHKSDTFTFERNKSKSNSIYINKKNISLKVKDDYLNKYSNLSNKINNLKKRSEELNNKIIAYNKKDIKIKKIQKSKSDLKIQILEAKKKNEEELNEKKNKIKSLRKIAKERNKSLQEIKSQKSHLLSEISKYDQNLVKSMINQTNYQNDTINKYKYLKSREQSEKSKNKNKIKILKKKKNFQKINNNIINKRMEEINTLKQKCIELERIKVRCIQEYQKTKKKVLRMNQSSNVFINDKKNPFSASSIERINFNNITTTPKHNKSNLSILTLSESYSTNSGQIKSFNVK